MRTVQQPQRITERERLANTSVAGSGGLFSASRYSSRCGFVQLKKCSTLRVCIMHAGVVTKAVHQGITQEWICTTEKVLNPECEQYVCRSRYKSCASRDSHRCEFVQLIQCSSLRMCEHGLKGTGYFLDKELSDKEHSVL